MKKFLSLILISSIMIATAHAQQSTEDMSLLTLTLTISSTSDDKTLILYQLQEDAAAFIANDGVGATALLFQTMEKMREEVSATDLELAFMILST